MHIAAIPDLTAKVSVLLALSLAFLCAPLTPSQAQSVAAPPPPEKVERWRLKLTHS